MWVLRNLHSSGAVVVLKFMTLMFSQFKRELKLHPAHTSTCSTVYEPFVVSVRLIILINITSNIWVCVRVCGCVLYTASVLFAVICLLMGIWLRSNRFSHLLLLFYRFRSFMLFAHIYSRPTLNRINVLRLGIFNLSWCLATCVLIKFVTLFVLPLFYTCIYMYL